MRTCKEFIPILILFFLIFFPFLPLLIFDKFFIDTGMLYSDMTNFYLSLKVWYQRQLQMGEFPFWTNLMSNGYPVFAEGELGALYPFNLLLYYFLPVNFAFNLNLFAHFLLAAFSVYFFARISLKLSQPASILASITYTFSGVFFARISYVHMIFIISYLPLNFFLVERLVAQIKLKYVFWIVLVFALQILAGYTEIFYYNLILSVLFFIFLSLSTVQEKKKYLPFLYFTSAILLAILVTAVQVLNNWEVLKYSHRAEGIGFEGATSSSWPFQTLSLFVNPHAFDKYQAKKEYHPADTTSFSIPTVYGYVGLLTLLLFFYSLILFRQKKYVFIFLILLVFTFLWAQGRLSFFFAILWNIVPGLKYFRAPVKLLYAIDFFLVILAALAFDDLIKRLKGRFNNEKIYFVVFSLVILAVWVDLLINNYSSQKQVSASIWTSKPEAVKYLEKNLDKNLFQIYSHGTNNLAPETTSDMLLQKDFQNLLPPNLNVLYNLPANRETIALFLKRQKSLNDLSTTLDLEKGILTLPAELKRSLNLQGVAYLLSDLPISDPDLNLVLEMPFYKETYHRAFLKNGQTQKIKVDRTHVYENKSALPRVRFVEEGRNMAGKNEQEILEAVLSNDFDPGKEVILESSGSGKSEVSLEEGSEKSDKIRLGKTISNQQLTINNNIVIKSSKENSEELEINTEKSGYLVLARTFYPGWKAWIDGRETEILRANYAFQAIPVSSGRHDVRLIFEPSYWRVGMILSGIGILIVFGGLGFTIMKKIK